MKIAIIGGGIGGMISGLLLANEGHEITIFEKESKLGGRLAFVEQDGFKIDKGPTIVLLPEMIKETLAEAGIDEKDYELMSCDPLYDIHFSDGSTFTKYADMDEQIKELERFSLGSSKGFTEFMNELEMRFNLGKPRFLEKSFVNKRDFWKSDTIKTLIKLKAYQNVKRNVSQYFKDERLQIAYALQTLYIGGNPFSTPAIYSLVSFSEHKHGIHYIKGGYASLVPILHKALENKGVEIRTNTKVDKIITDGEVASGVIVNDTEESYDSIIINGDFPVAEKQLMNEIRSYTPSSACLLLYLGVNKVYEEANVHQFFIGEDFDETMKEVFQTKQLPSDPSIYVFNPSIIDSSLAPDGKGVMYVLIPVPSNSDVDWVNGHDYIDLILERMERKFPRLREHIEWQQVRTPEQAEQEGLFAGGSFGIAPTIFQSGVFRPQLQPFNEKNIYAVGASVHPGGGIPIVMQGARLLASSIINNAKDNREDVVNIG